MKIATIAAFLVISLVQLLFPAKMIWDREKIIAANHQFKFKTAPVDPHDPFRGKYIYLQFQENEFKVNSAKDWVQNQDVFVRLFNDEEGYVKIADISTFPPEDTPFYIEAKVGYVFDGEERKISIQYPFERFYMEESKAYDAELAYIASVQDSSKVTYALVSVLNGEAVLNEVYIDDVSINDVIRKK